MGPYTSLRSNIRRKYSRFLIADSQGMYSVSFRRKRVEFRARVTLTSLALMKTEIGFNKIEAARHQSYFSCAHRNFRCRSLDPSAGSKSLPCQIKCVINELSSVHQRDPLQEQHEEEVTVRNIPNVKTSASVLTPCLVPLPKSPKSAWDRKWLYIKALSQKIICWLLHWIIILKVVDNSSGMNNWTLCLVLFVYFHGFTQQGLKNGNGFSLFHKNW